MDMVNLQTVARVFRSLCGRSRARQSPRPARRVPVALERLEERCVLAVLSGPEVAASFGPRATAWPAWPLAATPGREATATPGLVPAARARQTQDVDGALARFFLSPGNPHPFGPALIFFTAQSWHDATGTVQAPPGSDPSATPSGPDSSPAANGASLAAVEGPSAGPSDPGPNPSVAGRAGAATATADLARAAPDADAAMPLGVASEPVQ